MKSKIIEYLRQKDLDSESKCGTYVSKLICEFKIEYSELRPILNELFAEKLIKLRLGLNGTLLFPINKKVN